MCVRVRACAPTLITHVFTLPPLRSLPQALAALFTPRLEPLSPTRGPDMVMSTCRYQAQS